MPAMPVDFAMRVCLGGSPPLHRLLDTYEELCGSQPGKPLRPCLNLSSLSKSWRDTRQKKRVIFADMKGLSLTAVRIFSKMEEDLCDLHFALAHLLQPKKEFSPSPKPYSLDFPQPSSDYLAFRSRLQRDLVCLEHCLIHERSLSGTVCVRNVGFEKVVQLRVTFDSWNTFEDITCSYIHSTYGVADTDSFSFQVELPGVPGPTGDVEFCLSFCCGQTVHWDNNQGQNYRIRHAGHSNALPGDDLPHSEISHTDAAVFSHWACWASANSVGPYW